MALFKCGGIFARHFSASPAASSQKPVGHFLRCPRRESSPSSELA
jgi:hypothetical protein